MDLSVKSLSNPKFTTGENALFYILCLPIGIYFYSRAIVRIHFFSKKTGKYYFPPVNGHLLPVL